MEEETQYEEETQEEEKKEPRGEREVFDEFAPTKGEWNLLGI